MRAPPVRMGPFHQYTVEPFTTGWVVAWLLTRGVVLPWTKVTEGGSSTMRPALGRAPTVLLWRLRLAMVAFLGVLHLDREAKVLTLWWGWEYVCVR